MRRFKFRDFDPVWWAKPKKLKVLVVGSEGYIGSNLVLFGDYEGTWIDKKLGSKFEDVLPSEHYDVIVFLAAQLTNVAATYSYNHRLYEALDVYMESNPDTHVIYTSSAAVYPDRNAPNSEKQLPSPQGFYGRSKFLGECYVQQYKNHTILRLANVYGQLNGKSGNGVIDLFRYGKSDEISGNGKQIRDFVFISNVIKAINGAIENPTTWRGITNIGTGKGTTILEVFKRFYVGVEPNHKPKMVRKATGVKCSILDVSKMKRLRHETD